jgi:RNA polymerase sigma-70 factor (ECF subfamily)
MKKSRKEFSQIYDDFVQRIYRFVFLKVNSQETAQDITSETFSRAWTKARTENQESGVKNWGAFLYQIARNLVIDFYREKGKFQVVSASYVADPAPLDLEAKTALNLEMEQVKKALNKLGQEQQEVVIWRHLDGLSFKEISEILGKPEGTIRVILHRALENLRNELERA